ncbi:ABC transporter ATP-binding protein [Idiomarina xiamenensis]|uniref:ABC transporter ATPase n=1 Tax=Idiomarina xiamenensis 10-D-4 TaxID=740709 RepID=K2LC62_9GAMM|nr:ABC transporter ATP-binding protein [Idiomarina xiamenensis]EKE87440.1 ABC transporter ATPase [Idiomarina xiamenensis 10-D-4]
MTIPSSSCVAIRNLSFAWPGQAAVLEIPELTIANGEHVIVRGASGSGKSTLLSLLAGINTPQQGQLQVLGHAFEKLSGSQRDRVRADDIGYIFQQFNLLPYLTAVDNVLLACQFSAKRRQRLRQAGQSPRQRATELLQHLGLDKQQQTQPAHQLSVGQQQRVAAARALLGQPALLIADEPTSALDSDRRDEFIQLLFRECQAQQTSLIFVTHDDSLVSHFPRHIELTQLQAEVNHA